MTIRTQQLHTTLRRITRVRVRVVEGPDKGQCIDIDTDTESTRTIPGGRKKVVNRLVLNDPSVSDEHFELQLRDKGVLIKDLGSTNGIYIYGLRVQEAWIEPITIFRVGQSSLELVSAEPRDVELSPVDSFEGMAGRSEVMRELFAKIERFASRGGERLRILITGETGTGKELVARALHNRSPRAQRPFVPLNCAVLTPSLASATLFGHTRGAFTGADAARPGCFEEADGGTLFLDEIAELPMEVQGAFLRVLQENKVCRIGEFKERPVDVRVICATHQDLRSLVAQRQFREDLYFRLSNIILELPPLRSRGDDLVFLAERFLQEFSTSGTPPLRLSPEAHALLRSHHWPGNVRELASVIHTACMIADGPEIKRSDLSIAKTLRQAQGLFREDLLHLSHEKLIREVETVYYTRLQQLFNNNMTKMAGSAGMSVEGVRQALFRLGLRA